MIQLPRIYQKTINNFQELLDNFFKPLFEVTIDPKSDPVLFHFLLSVVGFDSVDDESIPEKNEKLDILP